jgi:hypothetical protein
VILEVPIRSLGDAAKLPADLRAHAPTCSGRIRFAGLLDIPDAPGQKRGQEPAVGLAVDLLSAPAPKRGILNVEHSLVPGRKPAKPGEALVSDYPARELKIGPRDTAKVWSAEISSSRQSAVACHPVRLLVLVSRSRRALAAENLFLRKQPALFQERKLKTHRADDSARLIMVILARLFSSRGALVNVQPDKFVRWHRQGFRLLWRGKSRPVDRPRLPEDLRKLIQEMAAENPTWGEERITNELKRKVTIQVSPRTVGKYLRRDGPVHTPTRNSAG